MARWASCLPLDGEMRGPLNVLIIVLSEEEVHSGGRRGGGHQAIAMGGYNS